MQGVRTASGECERRMLVANKRIRCKATGLASVVGVVGVVGSGLLLAGTPAFSEVRSWTNAQQNNDFYSSGNWSPVGGPSPTDNLTIGLGTVTGFESPSIADSGSLVIEGPATQVSFPGRGFLNVGETGTGLLWLRSGATLTNDNVTILGDEGGSRGNMIVEGPSTFADLDDLYVGLRGRGELTVSNGARLQTRAGAWIQLNGSEGGSGLATVTGAGSTLDIGVGGTTNLNMGANGQTGQLRVQDGGLARAGSVDMGVNGGRGEATVEGSGARWEVADLIEVGSFGSGSIDISGGGGVSAGRMGVHALTWQGWTDSSVDVRDSDSALDVAGELRLGQGLDISNTGAGVLNVSNRARVNVGGTLSLQPRGQLNVGDLGTLTAGTLDFQCGLFTTGTNSNVNVNAFANLPAGQSFSGSFSVGHSGTAGAATLDRGAFYFVQRGVIIGLDGAATASTLNLVDNATLDSGFFTMGFRGGTAEAFVEAGSNLQNFDRMNLGIGGQATLTVEGDVSSRELFIGREFATSDPTAGLGTLELLAGSTSDFRTVNLTPRGTLELELGATLNADTLNLEGDLIVGLPGTQLFFAGQRFDLLDFDFLTGTFASIELPEFTVSPFAWDTSALYTTGEIAVILASNFPGDFSGNGSVEQADLDLVLGNWGNATTPDTFSNTAGLTDGVDQDELDAVLANWGNTQAPNFAGGSIPEPATLSLIAAFGLMFKRHRAS